MASTFSSPVDPLPRLFRLVTKNARREFLARHTGLETNDDGFFFLYYNAQLRQFISRVEHLRTENEK